MTDSTIVQFRDELNSFFRLALLNMVFGALAMAFGLQFMIAAVLGLPLVQTSPLLRVFAGAISMLGFGLGLLWIVTSTKVLRGIKGILREVKSYNGPVPAEILTGWIVRMIAQYRENKKILTWMITISRLGGCCFVTLGIVCILQGVTNGNNGGGNWMDLTFPFMAGAINLTIGIVTIMISIVFHRYSAAWERRLDETAKNEKILGQVLERR
jgi:hypothetical protein